MTHCQLGSILADLDRYGWDLRIEHRLTPHGCLLVVTVGKVGVYLSVSGEPLPFALDVLYASAIYFDERKGGRPPPNRGESEVLR